MLTEHLTGSGWFDVVGDAGDGPTAIALAAELRPDPALLDLAMPGMDGLETLPHLLRACLTTRVAILSSPTTARARRLDPASRLGQAS